MRYESPIHGLRGDQRESLVEMSRSSKVVVTARCSRVVGESDPACADHAAVYTHWRRPMRNRTLEFHVDVRRPATGLAQGLAASNKAWIACGGPGAPLFFIGDLMSFGHDCQHLLRHERAAS